MSGSIDTATFPFGAWITVSPFIVYLIYTSSTSSIFTRIGPVYACQFVLSYPSLISPVLPILNSQLVEFSG